MAAKPRSWFQRHSQPWKYSNLWWYRQALSLNGLLVLEEKIFQYYFTTFIGFSQKARWPPYRASVWNAYRKLESDLANDNTSEISAQMVSWFWRGRFLNIISWHLLAFRKKQDGRHTGLRFEMPFANLKVLWLMMIWVKFQLIWAVGSGEEDFYRLNCNFSKIQYGGQGHVFARDFIVKFYRSGDMHAT